MRHATQILVQRAKTGLDMAIADVELSEAQLAAAQRLEPMEDVVDFPADFAQVLATMRRQAGELRELIARKASIL